MIAMDNIKSHLANVLQSVDGLHAIVISDRDGVVLVKSVDEQCLDNALKPRFLSTFGIATEQASKLGLQSNKSLVTIYNNFQVIFLNKLPLIVTMISSADSNVGMILALEDELEDILGVIKTALSNVQ